MWTTNLVLRWIIGNYGEAAVYMINFFFFFFFKDSHESIGIFKTIQLLDLIRSIVKKEMHTKFTPSIQKAG